MSEENQALREAIKIAGSGVELAKRIGVTPQAVNQWLRQGVPPSRVLAVERAVEGKVSRQQIRPDIYPPAELESGVVL